MKSRTKKMAGFTIIELTVTLGIAGILMGMAWVSLQEMMNPAQSGAATLASFFKEARARAISTTAAYTVQPVSPTEIHAFYSPRCGEALTQDNRLILNLPDTVSLTDITWSICYNSRGIPTSGLNVEIVDANDGEMMVEVFFGGAVRFTQQ